jgi:hypothetical protein
MDVINCLGIIKNAIFTIFPTTSGRNSGVPSFNPVDIDIAHNITKKNANLMPYVCRIKKDTL